MKDFDSLIEIHCSNRIVPFLCGNYAPICLYSDSGEPMVWSLVGPLCECVRRDCEPSLFAIGYQWPNQLTCDNFPTGQTCLDMHDDIEIPFILGLEVYPRQSIASTSLSTSFVTIIYVRLLFTLYTYMHFFTFSCHQNYKCLLYYGCLFAHTGSLPRFSTMCCKLPRRLC